MSRLLPLAVAVACGTGLPAWGQTSPWLPPELPRRSLGGEVSYPAGQECEPGYAEQPYAAYFASGDEVRAIPFEDTVFPQYRFYGLRLVVDVSAAQMTLPRGVWWISIQPVTDSQTTQIFYQVLDRELHVGGFPWYCESLHFFIWTSLETLLGKEAGDLGMKVVADRGQVLIDTTAMTDNQTYTNGFYNGTDYDDGRLVDDFIAPRQVTILKLVADYLTDKDEPPNRGVWVRFYENILCPQPGLDPPMPGRAGEVNEFRASSLRHGDEVHFVYGSLGGSFHIPGCGGVSIELADPVYMGHASADANGEARISRYVPAQARGRTIHFQVVQRTTCLTSPVLTHTFE